LIRAVVNALYRIEVSNFIKGLNYMKRRKADTSCNGSLREKIEKWRSNNRLFLICVCLISAFCLAPTCAADQYYQITNAIVTPEYGYEDFTYSADVALSAEAARKEGEIAVTNFKLSLIIYNNNEQKYTETITQRGKTSFVFGPYNFKNRFGIEETDNATFEFSLNVDGHTANTGKLLGPIFHPPIMTGIPSFEKNPYFFQGISVSAGFKDMDGLQPVPTCHLEVMGPLGGNASRIWNTPEVSCLASGKSNYACTLAQDLSIYRNGGNFSFKLVYNNLKLDPLTYGPYNISLQPYNPALEKVAIPKLIDYTNFTIQAYVKDAGAKMIGGIPQGSIARLIISHPQKGEIAHASSEPKVRADSLVYEWTQDDIPALFNRSDVQLSKAGPFLAKVVYRNENWNYEAEKSNISFKVVEEIPQLVDLQFPSTVYLRADESTTQDITVTVGFSKSAGDMNLMLSGPDQDLNLTEKGVPLGGNRYQYKWPVTFSDRNINNNYTLKLSLVHPMLDGGRYTFEDKFIKVLPLSVRFSQADVSPPTGLWNDSYTYSMKIDTTIVPLEVRLQTYDPCSSEWMDKDAKKAMAESSLLNWTLSPFSYECKEMQQQRAKYRFKASFAGNEYTSEPYEGPTFTGGNPILVSLDSDQVVYVSEGRKTTSSVQAVIEYAPGNGEAVLRLNGTEKSIEKTSQGVSQGGNRYLYDWSLPFDEADIGRNFSYTINYKHPSLPTELTLGEKTIEVKPLSIVFKDASVAPFKGRWNDTFEYSVAANTSVETKVALEIYNPCGREWEEKTSGIASPGQSLVNLTAEPFKHKCVEVEGKNASYRFIASFAEEEFKSDVNLGPMISGGQPELVSIDYTPVLHVTKNSAAYQSVKATVDFPQEQDEMQTLITAPDGTIETEEMKGVYLGGTRYMYIWTGEFGAEDLGNYSFSLKNAHPETAGGEVAFTADMQVVLEESSQLKPMAVGDVSYLPVLFVTLEKGASQEFSAEVFSPGGQGSMSLQLKGAGKDKKADMTVSDLGAGRYRYDYAEPFDAKNAGNSYMFSLDYQLDGQSYSLFNDHIMQVALEGTEPEAIWEPKLILEYDPTLYVPEGNMAEQLIRATINYSETGGILKLALTGPEQDSKQDMVDRMIGIDSYLYQATVPFEEKHIGNNYTISLAFNHSSLGNDFRFTDRYMRVLRKEAPSSQPDYSGAGNGRQKNLPFDDPYVTVVGNVTPANGIIQAWDEKDPLYALTYTLELQNWSSSEVPWIELSVRAHGSDQPWKIVGEKKRFNPSIGKVSWTLKPFWETPFIGRAEYRFLIDEAETQSFEGPEIFAVISSPTDSWTSKIHIFKAAFNSSENLTICLVGGDTKLPEKIMSWKPRGQCNDYAAGSGEQTLTWQETEYRPLYYDFDIKVKGAKELQ